MKFPLLVSLFVCVLVSACSSDQQQSSPQFYSADAKKATIDLKSYFRFPIQDLKKKYIVQNGKVKLKAVDQQQIKEALALQVLHLYGVFTYHNKPTDFFEFPGTIDNFSEPKILGIREDDFEEFLTVDFHFNHYGVFYQDLFDGENQVKVKFFLPNVPTTIYSKGFPKVPVLDPKTKKPLNTCTDLNDNTEMAFWYYWSPDREKCPASFKKELHLAEAILKVVPSTKKTFPEYEKLYNQHEDNSLTIDFIVGVDEKFKDPKDLGRKSFLQIYNKFNELETASGEKIFADIEGDSQENFRQLGYSTDQFDATINLHFVDPEQENWDEFAAESLIESDLMVFAGHSYEGYYFDPTRLFTDAGYELPEDRYQIFYLNSCTTYSYYNWNYFELKQNAGSDPQGTKYLDLVTNSIGAPFLVEADANNNSNGAKNRPSGGFIMAMSILGLNVDGTPVTKLQSWQQILGKIAANSGYYDTALTNVIGDEDNPKKLQPNQRVPIGQ